LEQDELQPPSQPVPPLNPTVAIVAPWGVEVCLKMEYTVPMFTPNYSHSISHIQSYSCHLVGKMMIDHEDLSFPLIFLGGILGNSSSLPIHHPGVFWPESLVDIEHI